MQTTALGVFKHTHSRFFLPRWKTSLCTRAEDTMPLFLCQPLQFLHFCLSPSHLAHPHEHTCLCTSISLSPGSSSQAHMSMHEHFPSKCHLTCHHHPLQLKSSVPPCSKFCPSYFFILSLFVAALLREVFYSILSIFLFPLSVSSTQTIN